MNVNKVYTDMVNGICWAYISIQLVLSVESDLTNNANLSEINWGCCTHLNKLEMEPDPTGLAEQGRGGNRHEPAKK